MPQVLRLSDSELIFIYCVLRNFLLLPKFPQLHIQFLWHSKGTLPSVQEAEAGSTGDVQHADYVQFCIPHDGLGHRQILMSSGGPEDSDG